MSDEDDGDRPAPLGSTIERGLFNSALDFFGAADAVIDYSGPDRPTLRYDVAGLQAVRSAMGALERRIVLARRAGMAPDQIARITRLEQEVVEMILDRPPGAAPGAGEE